MLKSASKTQLALEYAYRLRNNRPDITVLWLQCDSTTTLQRHCRAVARVLKIPGRDEQGACMFSLVRSWLRHSGTPWLVILDHIDNVDIFPITTDLVWAPFPQGDHGSILVTTNNLGCGWVLDGTSIRVGVLESNEVEHYLRRHNFGEELVAEMALVATRLDNIPLALMQIVNFVTHRLQAENEKLIDLSDTMLGEILSEPPHESQGADSAGAIWTSLLERLQQQNPPAVQILSTLVLFGGSANSTVVEAASQVHWALWMLTATSWLIR
jgi:hypothetical protein